MQQLGVSGEFRIRYTPPPGEEPWPDEWVIPNGPTNEGLAYLLNAAFRGATQSPNWYLGLISNSGFTALNASDAFATPSHSWTEWTSVSSSNRPPWPISAAADGRLTQTAPVTIGITANGSIRGAFLANSQAVSSGNVLYSTAAAASGRSVSNGGTLTVSYGLRIQPRT